MPHWFDDGLPYPWNQSIGQEMFDTLTITISSPGVIDQYYKMSITTSLPSLNLSNPVPLLWKQALEDIATMGGLATFCQKLQEGKWPKLRELAALLLELRPAIRKQILSRGVLVLDRAPLRDFVSELQEDGELGVIVVRGNAQSGKSHGRHIFLAAAKDRGALPVYLVDGMVATVDDTIDLLFSQYGESRPPLDMRADSTPSAVYATVCSQLLRVAIARGQALWIAVDGLGFDPTGARLLDEEIQNFFDAFALLLLNPRFRQWFRLMLIHYPEGALPTRWPEELWREDRPAATDIAEQHVAAGIREWSETNKLLTDEQVDSLAAGVIESADGPLTIDQPAAPRLRRINDELRRTLQHLGSAQP
jgi:hypothetical protein